MHMWYYIEKPKDPDAFQCPHCGTWHLVWDWDSDEYSNQPRAGEHIVDCAVCKKHFTLEVVTTTTYQTRVL